MSTKSDILDKINKKAKHYKELKEKSQEIKTPQSIVFEFLKEIESVYPTISDSSSFEFMLNNLSSILETKMRALDPYVKLEITWNDAEEWDKLRVEGVLIRWSDYYRKLNNVANEELKIDLTDYFMDSI